MPPLLEALSSSPALSLTRSPSLCLLIRLVNVRNPGLVQPYQTYIDVLPNNSIQTVDIATPAETHYTLALDRQQ